MVMEITGTVARTVEGSVAILVRKQRIRTVESQMMSWMMRKLRDIVANIVIRMRRKPMIPSKIGKSKEKRTEKITKH